MATVQLILISLIFSLHINTYASPIPGTSSSKLISSVDGLFNSHHGFQISSYNTSWVHTSADESNPYLITEYRAPTVDHGVQSALTIRFDKTIKNKKVSLKTYMKQWLKDYPRFGFKILNSKSITINKQNGFLLDIYNPNTKRQLRQVVFLKNKKAIILTCRAHKKSFKNSVRACNRIIRNFKWTI